MVIKNNKQIIDKWKTFAKKVFLISFPNWAKYGAKDTALIDPVLRHGPGENGKVVDMTKIKNFKIPIFPTSPGLGLSKEPSTRFLGASVLLLEPIE